MEFVIERQDGSLAFYDPKEGGPVKRARLRVEVDGYSAPLSAGNFVANILDGKYRNKALQVCGWVVMNKSQVVTVGCGRVDRIVDRIGFQCVHVDVHVAIQQRQDSSPTTCRSTPTRCWWPP